MSTIYDRSIRESVLKRVNSISTSSKRNWGKMTVEQMLCHVNDNLRVPLNDFRPAPSGNALMHTMGKWMVMNLPFPKGAQTHREFDPNDKGRKPGTLEEEKRLFGELVAKMNEAKEGTLAPEHPVIGKMTHKRWGILMAKHIDHHFRQFGA